VGMYKKQVQDPTDHYIIYTLYTFIDIQAYIHTHEASSSSLSLIKLVSILEAIYLLQWLMKLDTLILLTSFFFCLSTKSLKKSFKEKVETGNGIHTHRLIKM